MSWLRYLYLLICVCSVEFSFCMTPEELEQKLRAGCYSVLTVTRDYMRNDMYQLSPEDLSSVLEKAGEVIPQNQDPVFVVMNEYMCSRKTLEYNKFKALLDVVLDYSRRYPCAFYCINFLYQLKEGISEEEWNKLQEYVEPVDDLLIDEYDKDVRYTWPNNYRSAVKTLAKDPTKMFANESFLVNSGGVVLRYRKSTYCNEDDVMLEDGWSYYYGFGCNEPAGHTFSSIIDKCVYIDICLDIQQQTRLWLYRLAHSDEERMKAFFAFHQKAEEALQRLRNLLPKGEYEQPPESFVLHIVQSNSTAISDAIGGFSDKQVVVQSDPNVSSVFYFEWPEHVKRFRALRPAPGYWIPKLNIVSACYPYRVTKKECYGVKDDDFGSRDFTYLLYDVDRGGEEK